MLATRIRSGLAETRHDGAVAVSDAKGELIAHSGDIDRPFFLRSSAKPFQSFVCQTNGAELNPLELAMISASHRGYPLHISLVESILRDAGLSPDDLSCPAGWPMGQPARDLVVASGERAPRPIWHNCSGKHAGFLRACVARGWPTESYLDPGHPLQKRIADFVSDLGGYDVEPVGVDGCGAPVLRTNARAMSRLFARLAAEERFAEVVTAMHRYPAVIAANGEGDTEIAIATNSVAKGGAQGCMGIALASGLGIAVKSWDGTGDIAAVGAVAALEELGALSDTARAALAEVGRPPVLGGGDVVGVTEPALKLDFV